MPQPVNLKKAQLREIRFQDSQVIEPDDGKKVPVQFNPEKLGITFSNRFACGVENSGTADQFVNRGNTSLSVELWFDVTVPSAAENMESGEDPGDVRNLTRKVIYFFTPKESLDNIPPPVRFAWGNLLFDGEMKSLTENLEFFSEDGKPMRAKVTFNILKKEISVPSSKAGSGFGGAGGLGLGLSAGAGVGLGVGVSAGVGVGMAGTQPLLQAKAGATIQGIAGSSSGTSDWKSIALANNIENPRKVEPGTLLNVNVSGSIKVE
jgi:hypothetical protein